MFHEFDPERPLPPLLQVERTTVGDVAFLFCLQPARHTGVMYHEYVLGIEDKRADVHVARTDQADRIVDGEELGVKKVLLVQVHVDPGFEKLLII
jgi:hypothetical protein